ncbi:type II toxin-antitoxin system HigB family toxin [Billgrantia ethanolica]|nr:type II toxin-antitoxin system HigB family toxin [Halomonas ethanolica]
MVPYWDIIGAMRIIAIKYLRDFWRQHPDAKASLEAWVDEVKHAEWKDAHDIKAKYRSASPVGNKRVVFNIKGNDYRLIVAVAYRFGAVYIKFIGTHAEYDKVDAETVEME